MLMSDFLRDFYGFKNLGVMQHSPLQFFCDTEFTDDEAFTILDDAQVVLRNGKYEVKCNNDDSFYIDLRMSAVQLALQMAMPLTTVSRRGWSFDIKANSFKDLHNSLKPLMHHVDDLRSNFATITVTSKLYRELKDCFTDEVPF